MATLNKNKNLKTRKKLLYDYAIKNNETNVASAWSNLQSSRSLLESIRSQVEAAEIANEGITLEYDTGNKRTTLEVIQSRTLLLEARTSYVKAQRDFAIAQFNLLASIGDLYLSNIK